MQIEFYGADSSPVFSGWLERGLKHLYQSSIVPEQLDVPYDKAILSLMDNSVGSSLVAVYTDTEFFAAVLDFNQVTHHMQGSGVIVSCITGNGGVPLCRELMRTIVRLTKSLPDHTWMYTAHRTGRYTYRGRCRSIRSTNGRIQEIKEED